MARLDGKVTIITGAASGMGAAQAELFVREGARVIMTDISPSGQALAEALGDGALFVAHDVASEAQWASVIEAAEGRFGKVDALVNNAGIYRPASLADTTPENFAAHVAVNQMGVYLGMRTAAAAMKRAGGGAIVNISSTGGLRGMTRSFAYVASKWAVRGMTKAAAIELGSHNIRVNSIHPGAVETPMIKDMPAKRRDAVLNEIPLGRIGTPDDVARLALYLCSDDGSYTSGAEITVDGAATA